jgi:hypothetical protein
MGVPPELGEAKAWKRLRSLRERVEADPGTLGEIRAELGPVEAELWESADAAAGKPNAEAAFSASCWRPVASALDRLGA